MFLRQIIDPHLAQYSYLIGCQRTGEALVIDAERDIDRYDALATENDLKITAVAETHIHADFLGGAGEFATRSGVGLYLSGEGGPDWLYQWAQAGDQVKFLKHGDRFAVGNLEIEVVHTPGHTPEHLCFLITDYGGGADQPMGLVTGDFLFVGDVGRPDLLESAAGVRGMMAPSARQLQKSLAERLPPLSDHLLVWPGHGAGSACGKALGAVPVSSLGYERLFNGPLKQAARDPDGFVAEILRGQPEPPLYFAEMKRLNRDGVPVTGGLPVIKFLTPGEADRLVDKGGVTVLDSRPDRSLFPLGHLPGAIHAPLPGAFFSAGVGSFVALDEKILVVVDEDADAGSALRQLYRIGYDQVVGFLNWSKYVAAGGKMVTADRIMFDEFKSLTPGRDAVILDVRTTSEFEAGHVDGAVSMPYTRMRTRLEELPDGKRLYVHCGSGNRASLAASFLRARGFDAVHVDGVCSDCQKIAEEQGVLH